MMRGTQGLALVSCKRLALLIGDQRESRLLRIVKRAGACGFGCPPQTIVRHPKRTRPESPSALARNGPCSFLAIHKGCDVDSVLLISDDSDLAQVMRDAFAARGFRLAWEREIERGLVHCLESPHRGLLLDAVMKNVGAPQLVGWLRSRSPIPIVVLSTVPQRASLLAAFESGADDWIVGPFDPREVALRVCAVLRRSDPHRYPLRDFIGVGDIQIATASRLVRVDGCVVGLTSVEYDILEYLVREVGRVVSRGELMGVSCHRQASPLDRSLDVHISHLRRKLRRHGSHIRTVRGIGYMMASAKPDGVDHACGPQKRWPLEKSG